MSDPKEKGGNGRRSRAGQEGVGYCKEGELGQQVCGFILKLRVAETVL